MKLQRPVVAKETKRNDWVPFSGRCVRLICVGWTSVCRTWGWCAKRCGAACGCAGSTRRCGSWPRAATSSPSSSAACWPTSSTSTTCSPSLWQVSLRVVSGCVDRLRHLWCVLKKKRLAHIFVALDIRRSWYTVVFWYLRGRVTVGLFLWSIEWRKICFDLVFLCASIVDLGEIKAGIPEFRVPPFTYQRPTPYVQFNASSNWTDVLTNETLVRSPLSRSPRRPSSFLTTTFGLFFF